MTAILLLSIALRLAASAIALHTWWRIRDWRLAFLVLVLLLTAVRQLLTLVHVSAFPTHGWPAFDADEMVALFVSAGLLLAAIGVRRILLSSRHREVEARESAREYRDYSEAYGEWFWETDAEHRYTKMDVRTPGFGEWTTTHVLGLRRWEAPEISPPASDPHWEAYRAILDARRPFGKIRFSRRSPEGAIFWFEASGKPYFSVDGGFLGYRGLTRDVTSEVLAEEKFRQTEQRYRDLVEGSLQAIWISQDLRPVFANSASVRMFGYASLEEFLSVPSMEAFYAPEEWPSARARHLARMAGDAAPFSVQRRTIRKDGTAIWIDAVSNTINWNGRPGSQVTAIDITERKQAEQALRASERRFRDFSEAYSNFFWETDAGHRFTFVSEDIADAIQIPTKRILGRRRWEIEGIVDDPSGKAWIAHIADVTARRPFRNFRFSRYTLQGSAKTFEVNGKPCFDEEGKFLGYRGTSRDITEMVRAERGFRDLVEGSLQGIWITQDFKPVFANAAMLQMYGFDSVEDLLALPSSEPLFDPNDWPSLEALHLARMAGDATPRRTERKARRKDGSEFWVESVVTTVEWNGQASLKTTIDITERKRAELALRESEQRFRDISEAYGDWYWETDQEHRIRSIVTYGKHTGWWSADRSIGRRRWELEGNQNEPGDPFWRELIDAMNARAPFQGFRFDRCWEDGHVRTLEVNGKPFWGDDGEFRGYRGSSRDVTAIVRAERQLADSERRYRSLIEGSVQGIWITQGERVVFSNTAMRNMFGYGSSAELTELPSMEPLYLPEDWPEAKAIHALRMSGDASPVSRERQARRKDGTPIWVQSMTSLIQWNGRPAALKTTIDITERKRAEFALRDNEQRFRDFSEAYTDWFWESDAEHRMTFVSPEIERASNYPVMATIGMRRWEVEGNALPPEHETWRRHIAEMDAHRPFRDFRFARRRPNGEMRIYEVNGKPFFDWNQEFLGYRGTAREVTDQVRLQERYQHMIDGSLLGLFVVQGFRPVFANPAMASIFGYTLEEFLALPATEPLFAPEERPAMRQKYWDRIAGKPVPHQYEYQGMRKDGERIWIETQPILIDWNGAPAVQATLIDITHRKRAEISLRNANRELQELRERLEAENAYLQQRIEVTGGFEDIIGQSEAIRGMLNLVERVATTQATVLILGESGTGKELVATAIHRRSKRSARPLVIVNCAALPESLIESELFGHEKGAFTGAISRKAGRFELADGGTIFLDEIAELPLESQGKLLRVMQEGELMRLGSSNTIQVDVRIIAATNRDLETMVAAGTFREDLYYRLNVFPLLCPPLREREGDIPLLTRFFVQKICKEVGKHIDRIPSGVARLFESYFWPGNIRELRNVIERAVILSSGTVLHVDPKLLQNQRRPLPERELLAETLPELELKMIERALDASHGVIGGPRGAAAKLNIPASTLRDRIRKLGLLSPPPLAN